MEYKGKRKQLNMVPHARGKAEDSGDADDEVGVLARAALKRAQRESGAKSSASTWVRI